MWESGKKIVWFQACAAILQKGIVEKKQRVCFKANRISLLSSPSSCFLPLLHLPSLLSPSSHTIPQLITNNIPIYILLRLGTQLWQIQSLHPLALFSASNNPSHATHIDPFIYLCSYTFITSAQSSISLYLSSLIMEDIIQEQVVVACRDRAQIMKGKRTKRQRTPSPIRLAIGLPSATDSSSEVCSGGSDVPNTSSSELRDNTQSTTTTSPTEEEEDMANCLILLAQGKFSHPVAVPKDGAYLYQCRTCDRGFPSFRALGGHRARHKKMKPSPEENNQDGGCDEYCTTTALSLKLSNRVSLCSGKSSKVHECSICGADFSSGQALGGHMRRHRTLVNESSQDVKKPRNVFKLDLNLPAPDEDHDHSESKFPFHSKDSVLVFSASPLVDCHY